jgi:hypothetical protein
MCGCPGRAARQVVVWPDEAPVEAGPARREPRAGRLGWGPCTSSADALRPESRQQVRCELRRPGGMAAAARAIEAMTQFAHSLSGCKPVAVGAPLGPALPRAGVPSSAFHSGRCNRIGGGCAMRVRVLLQITTDDGDAGDAMEVAIFEKDAERPEDLGLSIA